MAPLRSALLVLACAALLPAPRAHADVRPEIRIGVMAPEGGRYDVLHRWDFLVPVLERALPAYRVRLERLDVDTLRDVVARGQVDFFLGNSGFYVEMQSLHGASALATVDGPNAISPQEALGSTIVVLDARHDLRRLADLSGRRIVAVNENLFGGFQVGLHALHDAGVRRSDLASVYRAPVPFENILEELVAGRADAAILRLCLFEQLTASERFPRAAFRVLAQPPRDRFHCARSTELYPDWAFARLKRTDNAVAKHIALALLGMPRTPDGYAWTVPTNHDRVHEVLRELEIGPYEYLSRRDAGNLLRRYRTPITLAAIAVLLLAAHMVRVETLVARRTAELRDSLRERERLAAEARAREEQFEHVSRLSVLGEMSSMIAHELNQPLAAMRNYANGIVRRLEGGRVEAAPLAAAGTAIAEQAQRAAGIMDRVRGLARKRRAAPGVVDLREVVAGAVDLFQSMVPAGPPIDVRCARDCEHGALVRVDRLQIEQVLLNLFKNALDAMHALPPAARRIGIELDCGEEGYVARVRDDGAGLAPDAAAKLFEPFYTTKPDGVGLGLAICKRIVEAHGGRMVATPNAPAAGLTVAFTLPPAEPPPAAAPGAREAACPTA